MKTEKTSKFFTYYQNNSGGVFDINKKDGIAEYVIVEAMDAEDADARAQAIGLYFNGVDKEMDCECCGDRWYHQHEKGSDEPLVYDQTPEDFKNSGTFYKHRTIAVHYIDGSMKCYEGKWK
jgi:hypothetical protein